MRPDGNKFQCLFKRSFTTASIATEFMSNRAHTLAGFSVQVRAAALDYCDL